MNKRFSVLQQRAHRLAISGTLLLALQFVACDNVQWGGLKVSITKPTFEGRGPADSLAPEGAAAEPPFTLPSGPVLFHVERLDPAGRARIRPVLELAADDEIIPLGPRRLQVAEEYAGRFNERYFAPGSTYTLFRGGARVGSFIVEAPDQGGPGACPAFEAEGQLELTPLAAGLAEFHAWPPGVRPAGAELEMSPFRAEMREMAGVLASRGVRDAGTPGRWRFRGRGPADLEPLRVGRGSRGFAATFMVGDSLAQGSPADSAGMVFLIADYDPARGYFPLYFDAGWYGPGGKRVLRWVDVVHLTADGPEEWLLRAYGDVSSWYEVIGQRDGRRQLLWSGRRPACEATDPSSP